MPRLSKPLLFPLLAVPLVLCWSSGFVGIRYMADHASVPQILFGRSIFSGLGLLPLALLTGPRITVKDLWEQAVFAFLGMFLYLGGFALAIGKGVPTGLVALMSDLIPLAIAALSGPLLGQKLSLQQWLGMGLGLAGVILVTANALSIGTAPLWAYALPVLGMLAFAVSVLSQEGRGKSPLTILQRLTLQCLWAALFFAPFAWATGGLFPAVTPDYFLGMAWLVLSATYGGWLIYYLMLRLYPAPVVTATIYLSPPVTMVWAWALWAEPLTPPIAFGLIVTLCGLALVAKRKGLG